MYPVLSAINTLYLVPSCSASDRCWPFVSQKTQVGVVTSLEIVYFGAQHWLHWQIGQSNPIWWTLNPLSRCSRKQGWHLPKRHSMFDHQSCPDRHRRSGLPRDLAMQGMNWSSYLKRRSTAMIRNGTLYPKLSILSPVSVQWRDFGIIGSNESSHFVKHGVTGKNPQAQLC